MRKKPTIKKKGIVQKIIKNAHEPEEKAEIRIEGADELYREIRVENKLEREDGQKVKLKEGATVDVTLEAEEKDTTPKTDKH
jgi:hypothetical protein